MYAGPIVKTYYSAGAYHQDSALMAAYGYQAINIEQLNMTNGLALTLILMFGLLLTPICIGVVILCFLPLAFSKRWNVTYIQHGQRRAFPYAQPQQLYSLHIAPPPHVQGSTPSPPAYVHTILQQRAPFAARVRDGFVSAWQAWNKWNLWQQILTASGAAFVIGIAIVGMMFFAFFILPH